jgi:hypothetical protein
MDRTHGLLSLRFLLRSASGPKAGLNHPAYDSLSTTNRTIGLKLNRGDSFREKRDFPAEKTKYNLPRLQARKDCFLCFPVWLKLPDPVAERTPENRAARRGSPCKMHNGGEEYRRLDQSPVAITLLKQG